MKIEFNEHKWGIDISLTPETTKEVAQLLRFSNNAAAKKPSVWFSFRTDEPICYIGLEKIKESVQVNSIKPGK